MQTVTLQTTKIAHLNYLIALNGGHDNWCRLTKAQKQREWENSMELRKAIGAKVWSNPYDVFKIN